MEEEDKFYEGSNAQKVHLPNHPFQRQRYWYDFEHFEVLRSWEHAQNPAK